MANIPVSFKKVSAAKFATITPTPGTIYWVTDASSGTTVNNFYFGENNLAKKEDIEEVVESLSEDGGALRALQDTIGLLTGLKTDTKTDIVAAINELKDGIDGVEIPEYTIVKQATAEEGYIASYNLTKNGTVVGPTINIPKDYLVKSALVKVVATANVPVEGYTVGAKYIDFVVNTVDNNGTESHMYILVSDLVDAYTPGDGINISSSNVVSIKINTSSANGLSVDTNGLALAIATTSTPGAMSAADKTALDSALQSSNITTGSENGTISVKGTDVNVKGLGSAAYTASTAYDAAGAASAVLGTADDVATDMTVYGVKKALEAVASVLVWNEIPDDEP